MGVELIMAVPKLKVILITMGVPNTVHSLLNSSINIIGIIESKQRNPKRQTKELRDFCQAHKIPYFFMNNGCNESLEKWVLKQQPDLIVVYKMSELLKGNILKIPKKGSINLHASYLPKYRGSHPIFWTFYYCDLKPGVTVHYIDTGEDTGDIIYQDSFQLPLGSTEEDFLEILETKLGTKLLIKAIKAIENNEAPRIKQPKESPTVRARQIKPSEYKEIINWEEWEISRIWNLLRGTQNWLNVFDFSEIQGKVLKWRILHFKKQEVPASLKLGIVYKGEDEYFIYCRKGIIFMEIMFDLTSNNTSNFYRR